jgi:hypothetical protein
VGAPKLSEAPGTELVLCFYRYRGWDEEEGAMRPMVGSVMVSVELTPLVHTMEAGRARSHFADKLDAEFGRVMRQRRAEYEADFTVGLRPTNWELTGYRTASGRDYF